MFAIWKNNIVDLQHMHIYASLWTISPVEQNLEVPVSEKLDMTQQCTPAAQKANCIRGFVKNSITSMESSTFPSGASSSWYTAPSSGMPSTGKTWTHYNKYRGDLWKWWESWSIWRCAKRVGAGEGKAVETPFGSFPVLIGSFCKRQSDFSHRQIVKGQGGMALN